jgi:hypothetical protein
MVAVMILNKMPYPNKKQWTSMPGIRATKTKNMIKDTDVVSWTKGD